MHYAVLCYHDEASVGALTKEEDDALMADLAVVRRELIAEGKLGASPIKDHVAAISVGILDGQPLLDLEYVEDSACDTDMNVVMTGAGHYVEVQGTAEGAAFTRKEMDALLALADKGIGELIVAQKKSLGE